MLSMTREDLERPLQGLIDVAQLLKERVGVSESYDIDKVIDEHARSCIKGKLLLMRSSQGIIVRGNLTTKIELTCSRCLSIFPCYTSFDIEEEFLPKVDVYDDVSLSFTEESTDFTISNDKVLDMGELIRQYTLLNLPMKPLCQPDCAGIIEQRR